MTTMGDRVRAKRDEMGLSQEALARELECSVKTVSRYETGEQRPRRGKRLSALARVLGVTEEWLEYGRGATGETIAEPVYDEELSELDKALGLFRDKLTPDLEAHIRRRHAEAVSFLDGGSMGRLVSFVEEEIAKWKRQQDGMPPKVKEAPATVVTPREGAMKLERKPKRG